LTDRDAGHRALSRKNFAQEFRAGISRRNFERPGEIILGYAGIGIAMLTLIENTVRVTIRHSDSEPIARAVATASISRDEATGAEWPSKPPAPDDRIMAEFLRCASESLATPEIRRNRRQFCGKVPPKMAK
jgi:hypothetical protein